MSLVGAVLVVVNLGLSLGVNCLDAAEPAGSVEFFENRIRPVLVKHCYECHSAASDEIGGSLILDSPNAMLAGGDSGPAVDPGDADSSMLIAALRYQSAEMPPRGKLPENVIIDFEKWIDAGAIDPRKNNPPQDEPATGKPTMGKPEMGRPSVSQIDLEAGRRFWAFQPLQIAPTPATMSPATIGSHSSSVIDPFIDDRLRQAQIVPNGAASPEVRLRRLAFDLTGLPPDRALFDRWMDDPTTRRWRQTVDSMLASPEFAEHWARHWMDVSRYADSNGADFNATHHEAWRYRDYLVRSFAADTPVDQMIRQQIAGDLLRSRDESERYDNVVATTFLMLGTKMLSERDKPKLILDVVDEQIDTVGRAFLAMTLGCARCHDHKFDPIPTEDYYALAGIFSSTMTLNGESQKYVSTWNRVPLPASDGHVDAVKKHAADVKSLEAQLKKAQLKKAQAKKAQAKEAQLKKAQALTDPSPANIETLKSQLADLKKAAPEPLPEAMAPSDRPSGDCSDGVVHIRGEVRNIGHRVPRGFLQVCSSGDATIANPQGSGRIELADWLTDPANPLVSRVFVNRVWMHLMGEGIVRTVDNFGVQGARPTHPALLDTLAAGFIQDQWRLKKLIRRIVTSAAYQRSSEYQANYAGIDPENRLLWRMHRRRIPAEAIRDAMLTVAGGLDRRARHQPMRGRGTLVSSNNSDSSAKFDDVTQPCRSIYLPVVRGYVPPLMKMLDAADPDLLVGKRPTSSVPAQALVLINSPEVNLWARKAAERVIADGNDFESRLIQAYTRCCQRRPDREDIELATAFFAEVGQGLESLDAWHEFIAALFASTEFRLLE